VPSSGTRVDRPSGAVAVARRYRRLERPLSGVVALSVGVTAAAALFVLGLVPGLVVALAVVALVRVPVFESGGSARLVSGADPAAVRADVEGPTPPFLAFQWGIADEVRPTADGSAYELSYLFGLRSVRLVTEVRPLGDGGPDADLELVVTADGRPWGTYTVSVDGTGDGAVLDVEWESDRRFGLNRLPQWLVAEHYRGDVLVAQGYAVEERDASLSAAWR